MEEIEINFSVAKRIAIGVIDFDDLSMLVHQTIAGIFNIPDMFYRNGRGTYTHKDYKNYFS